MQHRELVGSGAEDLAAGDRNWDYAAGLLLSYPLARRTGHAESTRELAARTVASAVVDFPSEIGCAWPLTQRLGGDGLDRRHRLGHATRRSGRSGEPVHPTAYSFRMSEPDSLSDSAFGASPAPSRADDLALALAMADAADAISLPRFGAADLQVTAKPDLTPVSDADLAVERAIRSMLATAAAGRRDRRGGVRRIGDADRGVEPGRRWVVDPIDGTKNFVRGVPDLGDADRAVRRRRRRGRGGLRARAGPALVGRRRVGRLRQVRRRAAAALPGVRAWPSWPTPRCPTPNCRNGGWPAGTRGFAALAESCWRTRAYGDFYSYMLVAEGAVDIAAEPELSLWDVAALIPIVTEAGGPIHGNRRSAIRRQPAQRAGHERPAARAGRSPLLNR